MEEYQNTRRRGNSTGSNSQALPEIQKVDNEAYINQLYDANRAMQEAGLKDAYDQNLSTLTAEQAVNQRNTDANLNRTYVESQKSQQGWEERQSAYGLSSGAMAQSRLARDTQLQDDLTALRAVQQAADEDVERRRTLLGQQYATAIQQAAAQNDLERVKALFQAAKEEEARLLQYRENAGNLMAQYGDFSVIGQLYGLNSRQIRQLESMWKEMNMPDDDDGYSSGGSGGYGGNGGINVTNTVSRTGEGIIEPPADKTAEALKTILEYNKSPVAALNKYSNNPTSLVLGGIK